MYIVLKNKHNFGRPHINYTIYREPIPVQPGDFRLVTVRMIRVFPVEPEDMRAAGLPGTGTFLLRSPNFRDRTGENIKLGTGPGPEKNRGPGQPWRAGTLVFLGYPDSVEPENLEYPSLII